MAEPKTTVTFLGTSAVVPMGGHDTASFVINRKYLVDTGWYAAVKMRNYGIDPIGLDYLILTHCHQDHYVGLPQLLFYFSMRRDDRRPPSPLKVVGLAGDVEKVMALAWQFLQPERFPLLQVAREVIPLQAGATFEDAAFRLDTCASFHATPGLCYRFTDKRTGASIAFTGDTAYHPRIVALVKGASLLIHEASFGPNPAPANNEYLHSGAPDAARLAAEAGVGRLALIHCDEDKQPSALEAARKIFPATFYPAEGETVMVE